MTTSATTSLLVASLLVLLAVVHSCNGAVSSSSYVLNWEASGKTFFDQFNFFTQNDYSHGFVNYVNYTTAVERGLIAVYGNQVLIRADANHVVPAHVRGRDSVRLESKKTFNQGLFIADLTHMPTGCGTWPAWWTYGPNWPFNGEIDIIEGVHTSTVDASTLHTNIGCSMAGLNVSQHMTGKYYNENCDTFTGSGCGVQEGEPSYGAPFNSAGGGVYAMEWTSSFIRVWFFNRTSIPSDLLRSNPNPANWPKPYAYFALGANCPAKHFADHVMVINLTFCGDWAGNSWVWENYCKAKAPTCVDYVRSTPSAFGQAYWLFNSIRVYQQS